MQNEDDVRSGSQMWRSGQLSLLTFVSSACLCCFPLDEQFEYILFSIISMLVLSSSRCFTLIQSGESE